MNIKIVIGSNFGDEGKGWAVDFLAFKTIEYNESSIVVRHNGGAQAGHTVVTPQGYRHVFHQYGAGSFINNPTYIADTFLFNPLIFHKEFLKLKSKMLTPMMIIAPNTTITTPYDMLINQMIELRRGNDKHGSCGVGIYETVLRNKEIPIFIKDLKTPNIFLDKLKRIRDNYISKRIEALKINNVSNDEKNILFSENTYLNFFDNCIELLFSKYFQIEDIDYLHNFETVIFENAQGLLLDQNNKEFFPHLTPSNTGLDNPKKIIEQLKIKEKIETFFITRSYITRHGAGSLPFECDKSTINENMTDITNVLNLYQGEIRYGQIDVEALRKRLDLEFSKLPTAKHNIIMTHLNETENKIVTSVGNIGIPEFKSTFPELCILNYGLTRENYKTN